MPCAACKPAHRQHKQPLWQPCHTFPTSSRQPPNAQSLGGECNPAQRDIATGQGCGGGLHHSAAPRPALWLPTREAGTVRRPLSRALAKRPDYGVSALTPTALYSGRMGAFGGRCVGNSRARLYTHLPAQARTHSTRAGTQAGMLSSTNARTSERFCAAAPLRSSPRCLDGKGGVFLQESWQRADTRRAHPLRLQAGL